MYLYSILFLDLEEIKEENEVEDLIADAWWRSFVSEADFDDYKQGPKLVLLFAILKECETIGDKVWVFESFQVTPLLASEKPDQEAQL